MRNHLKFKSADTVMKFKYSSFHNLVGIFHWVFLLLGKE